MAITTADKTPISLDNLARNNERMKEYIQGEIDKIPTGGSITIDDALSDTSENALQNKVIKTALDEKASKSLYDNTTINVGRKANTTVGARSTAEGSGTTASGSISHAEGANTIASGTASHAEGANTIASGNESHAGGLGSEAIGYTSFAHGHHTIANKDYEIAFGRHNSSNSDTLFSIGDGSDVKNLHNAFEITTDSGKLHDKDIATTDMLSEIQGDIPTKTSQLENDSGYLTDIPDNYATKTYVGEQIANAGHMSTIITLLSSDWTSNSQTISTTIVTANDILIVSPIPAHQDIYSSCGVKCSEQSNGSLTFTCGTVPTTNIDVNIVVM